MLKHLQKFFQPAQAETQEEVVTTMTTEKDQVALATDTPTAELTAQLGTVTEAMTALQAQFAELYTKYVAAEAALAASADAQAALVAAAEAKVQAARTEKLSAIMGDVKGPQMAASLKTLDDTAFETVVSGYAASYEAEEKSEMFVEKGVSAEALVVDEKPTHFNTFIKSKE
jgi:hypothetical protein